MKSSTMYFLISGILTVSFYLLGKLLLGQNFRSSLSFSICSFIWMSSRNANRRAMFSPSVKFAINIGSIRLFALLSDRAGIGILFTLLVMMDSHKI